MKSKKSEIIGTDNDDLLRGTSSRERILGLRGNDRLLAGDGDDTLIGGAGKDTVIAGSGNDLVIVQNLDSDIYRGGSGLDILRLDLNNPRNLNVKFKRGLIQLSKGSTLKFSGFETFVSGNGNDLIVGGDTNDVLQGRAGNDTIRGGKGDDTIIVRNFDFQDVLDGGEGKDILSLIPNDARALLINLNAGTVNSSKGKKIKFSRFEQVIAGGGNDRIFGDDLDNSLQGGEGDDEIVSRGGNDTLVGGGGEDLFVFDSANDSVDEILDFDPVSDSLRINAIGFGGGLKAGGNRQVGPLTAGQFVMGSVATDGNDRFLYDRTTGRLRFDVDGTGPAVAMDVAKLTTKPNLSANNILISGRASDFSIVSDFSGSGLTTSQRRSFTRAATRWSEIVRGVDGIAASQTQDLSIAISVEAIDGKSGAVANARITGTRSNSHLPQTGLITIDSVDLSAVESAGALELVFRHEIGHILGFSSSIWDDFGLIQNQGGSDPRYVGQKALQQYREIFNSNSVSIPLENQGSSGTRDNHWRKTEFGNELMTRNAGGRNGRISRVTVASLADIGYTVNLGAADSFTPSVLPSITLGGSVNQFPQSSLDLVSNVLMGAERANGSV